VGDGNNVNGNANGVFGDNNKINGNGNLIGSNENGEDLSKGLGGIITDEPRFNVKNDNFKVTLPEINYNDYYLKNNDMSNIILINNDNKKNMPNNKN
jgi:hypothetical protein